LVSLELGLVELVELTQMVQLGQQRMEGGSREGPGRVQGGWKMDET